MCRHSSSVNLVLSASFAPRISNHAKRQILPMAKHQQSLRKCWSYINTLFFLGFIDYTKIMTEAELSHGLHVKEVDSRHSRLVCD